MGRLNELKVAWFFIKWLNKENGTGFNIQDGEDENSEIDVRAVSDKGEELNLQIRTSAHDVLKTGPQNTKRFKKGLPIIVGDVDYPRWILEAIEEKENKYPVSLKKETTLLLGGCLPTPEPRIVERISIPPSKFKNIYYVSLPSSSFPIRKEVEEGYVICMK